jgi:hypothetical protein
MRVARHGAAESATGASGPFLGAGTRSSCRSGRARRFSARVGSQQCRRVVEFLVEVGVQGQRVERAQALVALVKAPGASYAL